MIRLMSKLFFSMRYFSWGKTSAFLSILGAFILVQVFGCATNTLTLRQSRRYIGPIHNLPRC
mgnify:CR=1 FL=1